MANRIAVASVLLVMVSMCAQAACAATSVAGDRVFELDGTRNTRDIGGYPTDADGTLRWGQVIRSDNLSQLTESDFSALEAMGVRTIVDLRTPA